MLRTALEGDGVPDRVLFADPLPRFIDEELSPSHRYGSADLIDLEQTTRIRTALMSGQDWTEDLLAARGSPEFAEYLAAKAGYTQAHSLKSVFPSESAIRSLSTKHLSQESLKEWIQSRDLVPNFARHVLTGTRYGSHAWRRELSTFPDRTAIGRLLRLIAWSAALRVLAPNQTDANFSNNYEDSIYAFIASYTFEIATRDQGLRRCIDAVFPGVRIRDTIAAS